MRSNFHSAALYDLQMPRRLEVLPQPIWSASLTFASWQHPSHTSVVPMPLALHQTVYCSPLLGHLIPLALQQVLSGKVFRRSHFSGPLRDVDYCSRVGISASLCAEVVDCHSQNKVQVNFQLPAKPRRPSLLHWQLSDCRTPDYQSACGGHC
jgi:hypothetical protein